MTKADMEKIDNLIAMRQQELREMEESLKAKKAHLQYLIERAEDIRKRESAGSEIEASS